MESLVHEQNISQNILNLWIQWTLGNSEAATRGVLWKKFHRNTPVLETLFNKVYWKETPTQVLSYEICEIFKNTSFENHLRTMTVCWLTELDIFKYIKYWCNDPDLVLFS